jgi:AAA domain
MSDDADRTLTYAELMEGDYSAPRPIIAEFIEEGTVANWSGLWGTGKTWMALTGARAVASGTSFLCNFPTVQGDVLYVDQENTPGGIQDRLRALDRAHPLGRDLPIKFRFVNGVRLDDLDGFRVLDRIFGEEKPRLVYLDSWIRFMAVNENNAVAVALVNESIRSLVLTHGCAIGILDHIRKRPPGGGNDDPSDRTRGSGEKIGFVENALTIERSRDDKGALIVHPLKHRYGELLAPFRVQFAVDPVTKAVALRYQGERPAEEIGKPGKIVEAIAGLKKQWGEDAADATTITGWLEWSESTTRRVLRDMVRAGLLRTRTVRPKDGGKGANRSVYDVVEER